MTGRGCFAVGVKAIGFLALLFGLLFLASVFVFERGDWRLWLGVAAAGAGLFALAEALLRREIHDNAEPEPPSDFVRTFYGD